MHLHLLLHLPVLRLYSMLIKTITALRMIQGESAVKIFKHFSWSRG